MAEIRTLPPSLVARDDGRWQPPSWLERWSPFEPVPVPAEEISRALIEIQERLEPASHEQIVKGLDDFFWLNNKPKNGRVAPELINWWQTNRPFYVAALADISADLVRQAFRRVNKYCAFEPKPADFVKAVAAEQAARELAAKRLGWAADALRQQRPPRAIERVDEAYVRERVAEVTRRLASPSAALPPIRLPSDADGQYSFFDMVLPP